MELDFRCPVCDSPHVHGLIRRDSAPIHQNTIFEDQQSAMSAPTGVLDITYCERCGFVFNRSYDSQLVLYGPSYDNNQTLSPRFRQHVDDLLHHLLEVRSVKNARIIEIGCGNGDFLRRLVTPERFGNSGYGFDPSYTGALSECDGRLVFRRSFYQSDPELAGCSVVICRHVIEHVSHPVDLLHEMRDIISGSSHGRIYLETPCVEWILTNLAFYDFFYEHCSYFSLHSLTTALELAGLEVVSSKRVFGEQYLWVEARETVRNSPARRPTTDIGKPARAYADAEQQLLHRWQRGVLDLAREGGVAIWGAGAKGVTFARLADPQRRLIACVVDINPHKQGKCVPGTGHPIVGYDRLVELGVKSIVLMNQNYYHEVEEVVRSLPIKIRIIGLGWNGAAELGSSDQ